MDEHRHHWSVADFYVERDRPMMRQTCACGAVRAIRAWDRSWDPNATHPTRQAMPDPSPDA